MISLANLPKKVGKTKKRVGRGNASSGTYSGRGQKGQRARSGGRGGLKRLGARDWVTKLPKARGFKSKAAKPSQVDIRYLAAHVDNSEIITPQLLKKKGIVSTIKAGVKVLGKGPINKKLKVKNLLLSQGARNAIEKAGGEIIKDNQPKDKPAKTKLTKESKAKK